MIPGTVTPVLTPAQVLARLETVDGVGSGLDTDLVRGRAPRTDALRFDPFPAFLPPPLYAETQSLALFGV